MNVPEDLSIFVLKKPYTALTMTPWPDKKNELVITAVEYRVWVGQDVLFKLLRYNQTVGGKPIGGMPFVDVLAPFFDLRGVVRKEQFTIHMDGDVRPSEYCIFRNEVVKFEEVLRFMKDGEESQ
jgi:hypothetical protein